MGAAMACILNTVNKKRLKRRSLNHRRRSFESKRAIIACCRNGGGRGQKWSLSLVTSSSHSNNRRSASTVAKPVVGMKASFLASRYSEVWKIHLDQRRVAAVIVLNLRLWNARCQIQGSRRKQSIAALLPSNKAITAIKEALRLNCLSQFAATSAIHISR